MKRYYTLEMLEQFYQYQEPSLSKEAVVEKAKILKRALNTLDISWARSNRRFYDNNQLYDFLNILN